MSMSKRREFHYKDVRIDTYHNGREFSLRLTHIPTNLMTSGVGVGEEFRTRDKLMLELAAKVAQEKGWKWK